MDQLIYPPSGASPTRAFHARFELIGGDWRSGFLRAGAPLVLVTAFKLLDMFLEWVLAESGPVPPYRYAQKIAALKDAVQFPAPVASRPWLRERLVALYERLEPLRSTIIHNRHFQSSDGTLEVSSSKQGKVGPAVALSPEDLRNLAVLLVRVLRYVEAIWTMDEMGEKRIRRILDELAQLHLCASLGQLMPSFLNVRVYVLARESVRIDLARVRQDVTTNHPGQDVMFNLRVVSVDHDGAGATTYLIPWTQLRDSGPTWEKATADLGPLSVALPADLDLELLAADLHARGPLVP